jgi:hypothetical protein
VKRFPSSKEKMSIQHTSLYQYITGVGDPLRIGSAAN